MIGPGTGVRVYLACGATDMRKGIGGLAAKAQEVLRQDVGLVAAQHDREELVEDDRLLALAVGEVEGLRGSGQDSCEG